MEEEKIEKILNEKFKLFCDEFRDFNRLSDDLRHNNDRRIDQKFETLQNSIRLEFQQGIQAHRDHIASLYGRFERIVWTIVVILVGATVFLGYNQFSGITDKIDDAIEKQATGRAREVEKIRGKFSEDLKNFEIDKDKKLSELENKKNIALKSLNNYEISSKQKLDENIDTLTKKYEEAILNLKLKEYLSSLEGQSKTREEKLFFLLSNFETLSPPQKNSTLNIVSRNKAYERIRDLITSILDKKYEGEDYPRAIIGIKYDIDYINKETTKKLTESKDNEEILSALSTIKKVSKESFFREKYDSSIINRFSKELTSLLKSKSFEIRKQALGILVKCEDVDNFSKYAMQKYIATFNDSQEDLENLADIIEDLPKEKDIYLSFLNIQPGGKKELSEAKLKLIERWSKELLNISNELNLADSDIENIIKLSGRFSKEIKENWTKLKTERQNLKKFTTSNIYVKLDRAESKNFIKKQDSEITINKSFSNSDLVLKKIRISEIKDTKALIYGKISNRNSESEFTINLNTDLPISKSEKNLELGETKGDLGIVFKERKFSFYFVEHK